MSELIERLTSELGYPLLDQSSFDGFIEQQPFSVLFFTEDPARFPESLDVAVILPELLKSFPQLTPAVISRDAERGLQGRYNFTVWPTLVLLKQGRYLGAISKVQDWDLYLRDIESLLQREPTRNPGIGIPVVVNPQQNTSCG
ncbi:hypothetical protein Q4508_14875 [Amphritea sp. 2_MG-2023]|uniref:hypothetical protein n=1 Tax=Amphritea TaxID=515417 RepID=UPI001C065B85|nr:MULTISPECIES: hypothetical protein [Amphritea]MBU2966403.1 hypothetical protein [Amphritea atlantica]MDO6419841.1 hypothetical protein [Amphritea sp. 2_MG-2023]